MATCECGCGEAIEWKTHHKYRPPRFKPGHHQRTPEFLESRKRLIVKPPPDWEPPSGTCECGCGEATAICTNSRPEFQQYFGFPLRYVHGHNPAPAGEDHPNWQGGTKVQNGYRHLHMPNHHLARSDGYVPEHRLVWERENGRRLKDNEDVHHIDGDRANNDPSNLVALTKRQHRELHRQHPQTLSRRAQVQRERFADPEARRRHSERMKRWWAERKARGE